MSQDLLAEMVQRIGDLERRLDDLAQPEQAGHVQDITVVKGWDGASNKASQTLNLQAAPWSLPASIKGVSVRLYYAAANAGDYGALEMESGDGHMVVAQLQVAGKSDNGSGFVTCDASGDIYFATNNATNTVSLYINAYVI